MSQLLTERLPILVSPGDLAAWKLRAGEEDISTSEFVRNAANVALSAPRGKPMLTEAEVAAIATQLAAYVPGVLRGLDRRSRSIDAALERIATTRTTRRCA